MNIPFALPDDRPLFFIHIPKTAGTTFTEILHQYFAPEEICEAYYWRDFLQVPPESLENYQFFRGHFHYSLAELLPRRPFAFTFLREPVERVISQYDQRRRADKVTRIPVHHHIRDFIADSRTMPVVVNFQTRYLGLDVVPPDDPQQPLDLEYTMPQGISDEALLDRAKQRLASLPFVGLTERFEESMLLFAHMMGWSPVQSYANRRVQSDRIRRESIDEETLSKIIQYNQLDLELYEFGKRLFEERLAELQAQGDLVEVVRCNYEATFARMFEPVGELHFDFAHVMPGTGWHPAEVHPVHGITRWSGPGAVSRLDLPLADSRDLSIEVKIIGAITPEIMDSFALYVNGHRLDLDVRPGEEYASIYRGKIAQHILGENPGRAQFEFWVKETVSPQALGQSEDVRKLGFAISTVHIS